MQKNLKNIFLAGILKAPEEKNIRNRNRNSGWDPWIRISIKTLRIRKTDENQIKIRPIGMAGS
jgi:hypothetical protein